MTTNNDNKTGSTGPIRAAYKSPAIDDFITHLTGKSRVETIAARKCMGCDGSATTFNDEQSITEYSISGLCQICQDVSFSQA